MKPDPSCCQTGHAPHHSIRKRRAETLMDIQWWMYGSPMCHTVSISSWRNGPKRTSTCMAPRGICERPQRAKKKSPWGVMNLTCWDFRWQKEDVLAFYLQSHYFLTISSFNQPVSTQEPSERGYYSQHGSQQVLWGRFWLFQEVSDHLQVFLMATGTGVSSGCGDITSYKAAKRAPEVWVSVDVSSWFFRGSQTFLRRFQSDQTRILSNPNQVVFVPKSQPKWT